MPAEPPPRSFAQALAREILASERLRVTILIGILGFLLALYVVVPVLFPAILPTPLRERFPVSTAVALVGSAILYEAVVLAAIRRCLATRRHPPAWVWYANALVDTTVPTLLVVMSAGIAEPVYALHLPPSLAYFLVILTATLHLDFWLCVFTGAVAAAEYSLVAAHYVGGAGAGLDPMLASGLAHGAKALVFLMTGVVAGFVARLIRRQVVNSFRSVEERNRIVGIFGQHVSPEVVDALLTQELELGGDVRHVCMMFLDIRDFTTYSETKGPEEVVQYLNSLFEFMVDIVNRHHGIVNKFLGDGFMAVFGAPIADGRDIQNGVAAAVEILARVEELNASAHIQPTRIGIGLHAGPAVTGNVGSARRKEYTIIGDTVNLAARIEQLNKQFGSRLLVSEVVWRAAGEAAKDAVPLGPVPVKGHSAPVQVYRLA